MNASVTASAPVTPDFIDKTASFIRTAAVAMGAAHNPAKEASRTNSAVTAEDFNHARINANLKNIEDMREQMEAAAKVAGEVVKRAGVKGNLTSAQLTSLVEQVKADSEYRANASQVKTTNVGAKIAGFTAKVATGAGAAVGGTLTFAVKAPWELAKMVVGKGSFAKIATATLKGAAAGAFVANAAVLPITGTAGLAGVSRGAYNAKREKALEEFTRRAVEKSAWQAAHPSAAAMTQPEAQVAPAVVAMPAQSAATTLAEVTAGGLAMKAMVDALSKKTEPSPVSGPNVSPQANANVTSPEPGVIRHRARPEAVAVNEAAKAQEAAKPVERPATPSGEQNAPVPSSGKQALDAIAKAMSGGAFGGTTVTADDATRSIVKPTDDPNRSASLG